MGTPVLHHSVSPLSLERSGSDPWQSLPCPSRAGVMVLQGDFWQSEIRDGDSGVFIQSWSIIVLFKSLLVLSHVPQVLIDFGFIPTSGLFIYFY